MENKIRFRNHISVILEQLGATFGILFVLSFTNIDDVIDYIEKGSSEELSLTVYIGGGVILAVFLLIFLYQWIIWSKTEQFRLYVMKLMQGQEGDFEEKYSKEDKDHWAIQTNMGDIFTHGLFSVNLLSVLVVIGCVVGAAGMVLQVIHSVSVGESIVKMLLSVLMLIAIFSSAIWNIVKGFIQYYDFKIDRNENKLYIRYGILKKVNYTIPAEKISALKLKQTFFARLTGRYTAEIINIGMGDDAAETQSFFLPYCKRNQMEERIRLLLPEFYEAVQMQTVRQPIATWIAWIWPAVLFALFLVAGALPK